jgi:hypothetical protein
MQDPTVFPAGALLCDRGGGGNGDRTGARA